MSTNRPVLDAEVTARRFPAGVTKSQWLVTVVLAAAAGAVMLAMSAGPGIHQTRQLVIPLLACGLIIVLRRWSLPALGVVSAAAVLLTAWGMASFPFGILLGLALYFSALGLPRSKSIVLVLVIAAALGAAEVYSAVRNGQLLTATIENLVPLAGAWFIADAVAARRRYQVGLAWQIERERAAEVREERVRIAREMHDVVAHALAVITVQAGVGRRLAGKRPEEANAALESIETIGRTAQEELRVVLGLLRDGGAGTAPLAPAPRLIDVKDLVDTVRASGTPVELRIEGTDRRLSLSLELSIYRVVQEALTNVVKHAPGARAAVELTVSADKVRLDVHDDGGPDRRQADGKPPGTDAGTGHGIAGMRERIGAFGGWLVAEPAIGGGFQVTAEVPIEGVAS